MTDAFGRELVVGEIIVHNSPGRGSVHPRRVRVLIVNERSVVVQDLKPQWPGGKCENHVFTSSSRLIRMVPFE